MNNASVYCLRCGYKLQFDDRKCPACGGDDHLDEAHKFLAEVNLQAYLSSGQIEEIKSTIDVLVKSHAKLLNQVEELSKQVKPKEEQDYESRER